MSNNTVHQAWARTAGLISYKAPSSIPSVAKVVAVVATHFANSAPVVQAQPTVAVLPDVITTSVTHAVPVAQPLLWGFAQSKLQQVVIGLVIGQVQNASLSLLSKGVEYFWGGSHDLADVATASQAVLESYQEVIQRLTPLIMHFHEAMQKKSDGLEQGMALRLEEALRLQSMLDSLTEDDLNAALKNLATRLEAITLKHQENLPILLAVTDNLQAAEKDLAEAASLLEKAKGEFKEVVEELSVLQFLIEQTGLEQDEELRALVQKLEDRLGWRLG